MTNPHNDFDDAQYILDATSLLDRFLSYTAIDTQSDEKSDSCPSTPGQMEFARTLAGELDGLGAEDAAVDENGYVYSRFPGNSSAPAVGFIAHMDTSPSFPGANVRPLVHEKYNGGIIEIRDGVSIDPSESPELDRCTGHTVITSDGTTLLGADDKAGIASIFAALEILASDETIPRPDVCVGFTPDEEIGRGADHFDVARFGANAAYTVDGGFTGEFNSETFSGDKAVVTIRGVAVHPGRAKGKMVNALDWASELINNIPADETPRETDGRDGFFHPVEIYGDSSEVHVELILRDFDDKTLEERGERLREMVAVMQRRQPGLSTEVAIERQYRNMAPALATDSRIVSFGIEAIRRAGVEPDHRPLRGGTDGSNLTAMGLPTPNIFTGGANFHGPREWVSAQGMALASCTILNLLMLWVRDA